MQSNKTSGGKTVVFFDLEATGLETWRCEIIQLAAISGERTFNVYTMPEIAIDRGAAEVTGFSVRDGALLLQSLEQPVLLAAHGARRFDKPVLDRALLKCSLTRQFQQLGSRFLDTFLLSKALYPCIRSYSQVNLVRHFRGKSTMPIMHWRMLGLCRSCTVVGNPVKGL
ncbi:unnamed protein product [Arctogadus glacialis]